MKRLIVLGLVAMLCLPLNVNAASIGSAETQGKGKAGISLDSEYIFSRDWKIKSVTNLSANESVNDMETDAGWYAGTRLIYGLLENLDIYAMLGAADYEVKDKQYTSGTETATDKFDTDTDMAYGAGLKGSYDLNESLLLGFDMQYRRSEHEAKDINVEGSTELSTTYKSFELEEWHVASYIGYKAGSFMPYLGVRYSDARLDITKSDNTAFGEFKTEADDNFGVFLGTDFKMGDNVSLNIEGRFIDETAVSTGLTWKL